jgi:hypothetical protein
MLQFLSGLGKDYPCPTEYQKENINIDKIQKQTVNNATSIFVIKAKH